MVWSSMKEKPVSEQGITTAGFERSGPRQQDAAVATVVKEAGSDMREWTYDVDAVEQAASFIERELMTVLDRLNIRCSPRDEPVPKEARPEGLNHGEQLYSALKALERLEDDFREMLTSWELSPERQAENPTENVVLDGYPDQASIDLRLAHGFALVQLKAGELAWVMETALEAARHWPLFDDLDGASVLLTQTRSAVGMV